MAYVGSTASSSPNPPTLMTQRIAGGPAVWAYKSTNTAGTAAASSYFSDGDALGMRVGDFVHVVNTSTAGFAGHAFCVVSVVTSGAGATITCATSST